MADGNDTILVGTLTLELEQLDKKVKEANRILASIGKDSKAQVAALTKTYESLGKSIADTVKAAKDMRDAQSGGDSEKLLKRTTMAYHQLKTSQTE